MTSIIFGAAGQDGYYLSKLLEKKGIQVVGVSRSADLISLDIANYSAVSDLVKLHEPDFIFHLAANSTTRHDVLFENHETISTGTLNILEAVRKFSPKTKVFISGSGLQFKNENRPIKETDPFEARDAYCVSRIQSVYAARYFRTFGIKVYVGYFFNHDSPRRSERHIAKKIAEGAKRIASGSKEKIEIGDLNVKKEWTFAGDTVEAVWKFISQDDVFESNIGSGVGHSILDWVVECFGIIAKDYKDYVFESKNFVAEYKQLISDASLIKSLGFQPQVTFSQLAQIMMTS